MPICPDSIGITLSLNNLQTSNETKDRRDREGPKWLVLDVIRRLRYYTLTLQKSRMPQIQGVEGEAVVSYC